MRVFPIALAPLALLAACGDDKGTSISIAGKDSEGKPVGAVVDGNSGQVKINVPGFAANVTLPKMQIDAKDLDLNGVTLYPGSTVAAMNIDAGGKDATGEGVSITFDSPADPATVKTWFVEKMKARGLAVAEAATGISVKTGEGDTMAITLAPAANGHSAGTIRIAK